MLLLLLLLLLDTTKGLFPGLRLLKLTGWNNDDGEEDGDDGDGEDWGGIELFLDKDRLFWYILLLLLEEE